MSFATEIRGRARTIGLALAGLAALCATACNDASVAPEDIAFEEIQVDGFAYYWANRLFEADSTGRDVAMFFSYDSLGRRGIQRDSLLRPGNLAALPAHTVDTTYGVVIAAKRRPKEFTCMATRTADLVQSFGSTAGTAWIESSYEEGGYTQASEIWRRVSVSSTTRPVYCEYIEGLGFRIYQYTTFGTITIRY